MLNRPGPLARALLSLVLISSVSAACDESGAGFGSSTVTAVTDPGSPTTVSSTSLPPTTTTATATGPPPTGSPDATATEPACLTGDIPFSEDDGVVAAFDDGQGDAATITGLRWSIEEGCERFVIDLTTTSGAPAATIGPTRVHLQAGRGIVRVELPSNVDASAIADAVVDGSLISAAYVVTELDGSLVVDLHLDTDGAVAVRAFRVTSPVRVVVDVQALGTGPAATPPLVVGDLVLVTPRDGPAEYPLEVEGYVHDGAVTVFLAPDVPDRIEGAVLVASAVGTWAEYRSEFEEGPEGTVELQVTREDDGDDEPEQIRVLLALE